ncbi:BnaC02g33770D [Brassica napus]|uniref:(rape) hypothetical protein n=1 Tax=Brassica napus TaxID=3708 RepID=A0A078HJ51_BRANA|nr:unnamed protein product [Brassica napus]CDY37359.1 BnaC02g33770D [Brassica napus]
MLLFVNSSSKNLKVVQLFKVYDAIGDYRTSSHPYKIGFFHATFVAKPNDFPSEVPEKYLADYTEIPGGKADNSRLVVNVIGQIGRYAKQVYDYSMSNMPTMIICVSSLLSGKRVEFNPNFTQPNMDLVDQFKTSLIYLDFAVSLMIHLLLQTTIVPNRLLVLLHLFVPSFLFLMRREP